ncbi:unnamed protein product [[Candida] boidinii]|uniref:Unnamed protein product n=1 Tax=Candida boidinii TaxID=5477 RepID=A0ACB5UB70_CANBO|nr:unnamed protein product [[Candida] boidinii]
MAQQTSTSSAQTQDNSHDASTVSRGRSLRVIQKLFTSDKSDEDVSSASTTSVHTPTGSTPFPNGSNNEISSSMSNHSRKVEVEPLHQIQDQDLRQDQEELQFLLLI